MGSQTENKINRTFKISLEERTDFKSEISAFLFDIAGNLLETVRVTEGKASFSSTEDKLVHGRLFIAPMPDQAAETEQKPTVSMMERIGAYEPIIRHRAKFVDVIRIPGSIIDIWPKICLCRAQGHVVKAKSGFPICCAKVHICEVDKVWRWIRRLPDLEVIRFRDDLLKVFDEPLPITQPEPDPSPFTAMRKGLMHLGNALIPQSDSSVELGQANTVAALEFPINARAALTSTSTSIVRKALIDNVQLILPYLCRLKPRPRWWRYRCDEIAVVETDALGRFRTIFFYPCKGDKPDLYFWVEYEFGGKLETVYRPTIRCHTYWNYACGSDVTIRVSDERVPACNNSPDLPGCLVQIVSIGNEISMSEIRGPSLTPPDLEGLTTDDQPFGGKLEPRVWFSRTTLRDVKHIMYYRWSYSRLTASDGTVLAPGDRTWTQLSRTVVRHYAIPVPGGGKTDVPLVMGPHTIGSETNLFEIRSKDVPPGGIDNEWMIDDDREDLASAHFETNNLGSGADACAKALDSAGKYELKLELFKDTGDLVDWTVEGIELQITNVPAPFGIDPVTYTSASDYHRIKNAAGHTMAFRMVVRVDNNCCQATVEPVQGVGLGVKPCGFIEYTQGASAILRFKAYHPNGFADFDFSLKRGVTDEVKEASAEGQTGSTPIPTKDLPTPSHAYNLVAGEYQATFDIGVLLGPCTNTGRAAFSEAVHVLTKATDGYGRLWYLDAWDHGGFALTTPP